MGACPDYRNWAGFYSCSMRLPEQLEHTSSIRPAARTPRRSGPGRTAIVGLVIVALGLLVALVGAQLVASALGPAGAIAATPAVAGLAVFVLGGLIECAGVAVFSERLTPVLRIQTR